MLKYFILAAIAASVVMSNAAMADVQRDGNTFTAAKQAKTKAEPVATKYTYKSGDAEYPIYLSGNGRAYIVKISAKTGKEYKQYLGEEISRTICSELGAEYTLRQCCDELSKILPAGCVAVPTSMDKRDGWQIWHRGNEAYKPYDMIAEYRDSGADVYEPGDSVLNELVDVITGLSDVDEIADAAARYKSLQMLIDDLHDDEIVAVLGDGTFAKSPRTSMSAGEDNRQYTIGIDIEYFGE